MMTPAKIGLYLHIPYCRFMCHYCDFAKTANWDESISERYFSRLAQDLKFWLSYIDGLKDMQLCSIYLGGGTPGLFTKEFESIIELLRPHLSTISEFTIEANPEDLSEDKLSRWREWGINRLSVGIQTFQEHGLKFLTRFHNREQCFTSFSNATNHFSNINLDLIYGWPGQTTELWKDDLKSAIDLGITHLSLYNLIYEPKTPIGRAYQRGRIEPQAEDQQIEYYQIARQFLADEGFFHEEVSNWAHPQFKCQHNHLYWSDSYYVGVGSGAHGYLPHPNGEAIGLRYYYPKSDRRFLNDEPLVARGDFLQALDDSGLEVEKRDAEDWLLEYVGCSLRSYTGLDLERCQKLSGKSFRASPLVNSYLSTGKLTIVGNFLYLLPEEWIRETAWSLEIIKCMT